MAAGTRVDLHVKALDEGVLDRAVAKGIDVVVFAPHFTRLPEIRERAARLTRRDVLVVPAREIFTGTWRQRKHLLAVGLTDPVPDFITLEGAISEVVRQDAAILVPHPTFATVSLGRADVQRYREAVHALEVYNPKQLSWHNRRARGLSDEFGIPRFASSYAHLPWTVGEVWTEFETGIADEDDLVAALKAGRPRHIGHRSGIGHDLYRAAELGHLAFENSWRKLDRVVLSDLEVTHPTHPAYDGRFDDVIA